MADLEAVLADVSYLMAMEKSKSTPAARASKRIQLPDASLVFFQILIFNCNFQNINLTPSYLMIIYLP